MGDTLIATDADGNVLFLNPLAERLTGWTLAEARSQAVGKIYQAIDEHSGEAVQRLLVDIARGGDVVAVKVDMELIVRSGDTGEACPLDPGDNDRAAGDIHRRSGAPADKAKLFPCVDRQ